MSHLNEFEGYHGFVYIDEEQIVRSSDDGCVIGVPMDVNSDRTVITVQMPPSDEPAPPLTLWQRVMRWIGWTL